VADKPVQLVWTHKDRLGSPVALTGDDGQIIEQLAYDAWGKRRSAVDNTTPDTVDGVTDHRGFTGHEMLDQLDLVHMNGRVYDPSTAKFLSGDPLVQDPMNGQSYNRYSYVLNNPTNLTDPTGFLPEEIKDVTGSAIRQRTNEGAARTAELYGTKGTG
jgi:RHS repeat-associated protein